MASIATGPGRARISEEQRAVTPAVGQTLAVPLAGGRGLPIAKCAKWVGRTLSR